MSGVYQIYNTVNGKRYIGSSIHIEQRFKEHLRNLRSNKHVNAHLQSAWNKYGEHSFILEEIELCEPDQCLKVEQEYIDYYHAADRKFGYNIDPYADHAGNTLSEETRKKISEKAKGRKWSKERHENWSKIMTGRKKPKQAKTMAEKFAKGEYLENKIYDYYFLDTLGTIRARKISIIAFMIDSFNIDLIPSTKGWINKKLIGCWGNKKIRCRTKSVEIFEILNKVAEKIK